MRSDIFILPFNLGLYFILLYVVARSVIWFRDLSRPDKLRLPRGFFGRAYTQSLKEIFMESLLHRKIFRINPLLGYMHMSLAFGWFLLIVFGTIEADIFSDHHLNPPHKAIFFRYYHPEPATGTVKIFFTFLMDLILAFILSGLLLAIAKRIRSRIVGMKKTTRHTPADRVALTALWLIFPSRLLAESFTCAAYGSGGFLTGNLGALPGSFLPPQQMAIPFWWLYSLSLGTFFFLLPRTRYMHIPMELFLIFMRNSGIRTGDRSGSFSDVELYSCSSCGICLNSCQMALSAGISNIQPVYLNKGIREGDDVNDIAFNCLLCGRCEIVCPVGIETSAIRMIQRRENGAGTDMLNLWKGFMRRGRLNGSPTDVNGSTNGKAYTYLSKPVTGRAEVAFFAGCMTHLTPSVIKSMETIFREAGISYTFIDREKGICCGRPLMLTGQEREARELINMNSAAVRASGASVLVTPCPICYRVFSESYYLETEVMHHSQYIESLITSGRLRLRYTGEKVVWHDPCELGRGSGVYDEPRNVLKHIAKLQKASEEEEMGVCCGGSLGNIRLPGSERRKIAVKASEVLSSSGADTIVTGCPLCKRTFVPVSSIPVRDIAELTAEAIYLQNIEEEVGMPAGMLEVSAP
jgi:Fe-S oxidoreductase